VFPGPIREPFGQIPRGETASIPAWASDFIFDPEDAKGERVLSVLPIFAVVFSAVFLLVPLLAIRQTWRQVPFKLNAGVYFASLGLGFMFLEICMI
jgi:hypothetical protein